MLKYFAESDSWEHMGMNRFLLRLIFLYMNVALSSKSFHELSSKSQWLSSMLSVPVNILSMLTVGLLVAHEGQTL